MMNSPMDALSEEQHRELRRELEEVVGRYGLTIDQLEITFNYEVGGMAIVEKQTSRGG